MPQPGLFITATDTDAGKTFVTAHLLRSLLLRGDRALAVKPVQTGCEPDAAGVLHAPDVDVYRAVAGELLPESAAADMTCLTFRRACSPHLAAAREGRRADPRRILDHVARVGASHRPLLVEGAGGVLVPLEFGPEGCVTMLDLMERIGLPVLLAAPNRLGTVNHILLSLAALLGRGLRVAGVVLTRPTPPAPEDADIRADTAACVTRLGGVPVLGEIPYEPDAASPAGTARLDDIFAALRDRLPL